MKEFKPSPRYLTRLRVLVSLWAVSILVLGIFSAGIISLGEHNSRRATLILQAVMIIDLSWYLPALILVRVAYTARIYCFKEEEIIIQSGWWTKSIRRIPLSSVIAFEERWDRLDRWLEIGSLDVYIAPRRNRSGSRVRLAGLADVEMVAELAACQLQRLRDERMSEWALAAGNPKHRELFSHNQI